MTYTSKEESEIMPPMSQQIAKMVELLPENDQLLAFELVKKLVLAWDPDFTKLTDDEEKELEESMSGEYVDINDIDWN